MMLYHKLFLLDLAKSLFQIRDQIVSIFKTDGKSHKIGGHFQRVPATEAWVMAPGCSIRDSTPPNDSAG